MALIKEFDLEDLWRRQNPNGRLYTHFHGRSNTYTVLIGLTHCYYYYYYYYYYYDYYYYYYYYYYYFYSYHEYGFLNHIYIKVNRLFTPVDYLHKETITQNGLFNGK